MTEHTRSAHAWAGCQSTHDRCILLLIWDKRVDTKAMSFLQTAILSRTCGAILATNTIARWLRVSDQVAIGMGEQHLQGATSRISRVPERLSRLLEKAGPYVRSNVSRNLRHAGDLHGNELVSLRGCKNLVARRHDALHVLQGIFDRFNLATVHQHQNPYTFVVAANGASDQAASGTKRQSRQQAVCCNTKHSNHGCIDSDVAAKQPMGGR